jgi:hypothetical protein
MLSKALGGSFRSIGQRLDRIGKFIEGNANIDVGK